MHGKYTVNTPVQCSIQFYQWHGNGEYNCIDIIARRRQTTDSTGTSASIPHTFIQYRQYCIYAHARVKETNKHQRNRFKLRKRV